MKFLYNLTIVILYAITRIVALFNSKTALWVRGVKGWQEKISENLRPGDRVVWIHCASLGEFEQGRPVIETLKKKVPELKIVLTFFSPSGYEIRKNYQGADCVCYLPADTTVNAVRFVELVSPEFVIFVKYEFWNNYISELYRKNIPVYLISAIFRTGQHFFKWYGSFFRRMLKKFSVIFVQDVQSLDLLASIGVENTLLAGDTRFDRVVRIAGTAEDIKVLEEFRGPEKLFLAGSSWKQDEEIIARYINSFPESMKWVFAPHEIDTPNIERLEKLFTVSHVRFSGYDKAFSGSRVLIIDNIGMLSSAYRYASIAAVGGGFNTGVHNILEPACWGIPVLFGPDHKNFREALGLIGSGGARCFTNYEEFKVAMDEWVGDISSYNNSAEAAKRYVNENTGATDIILKEILPSDINRTN